MKNITPILAVLISSAVLSCAKDQGSKSNTNSVAPDSSESAVVERYSEARTLTVSDSFIAPKGVYQLTSNDSAAALSSAEVEFTSTEVIIGNSTYPMTWERDLAKKTASLSFGNLSGPLSGDENQFQLIVYSKSATSARSYVTYNFTRKLN